MWIYIVTCSVEQSAARNNIALLISGDEERDPVRLNVVRRSGGCHSHRWRTVGGRRVCRDQTPEFIGGRPVADDQILSHFVAQINCLRHSWRCRPERRVGGLRQVVVTRGVEQSAARNNIALLISGDEERDQSDSM